MNLKLTLDQMKDLSIDEILRLYQMGYRIEDNLSNLTNPIVNLADPIVNLADPVINLADPIVNVTNHVANLADPIVDPYVNFGKATVSTGYNDLASTITLNIGNGSIFPDPSISGAFNLVWWNSTDYGDPSDDPNKEIVRCTSNSGDILTISRAQEGTVASVKNISGKTYKMILSVTAKAFTDLQNDAQSRVNTHSSLVSGTHGVIGNLVGTSDTQGLINKTITDPSNDVTAKFLKSSTTTIDISTAIAPTAGQVLAATSSTNAEWQSLSTPNRPSFVAKILDAPITGVFLPDIPIPNGFSLTIRSTVSNPGQVYIANSIANAISSAIPGNRNALNAGDAIVLYVSNANVVAIAGSNIGNTVDILVEQ
jgi:hypothetical protein